MYNFLLKVSKGKEEKAFYSIPEYEEWKNSTDNVKSWKVKYYKGLGTSTPKEAKEYFADMHRHQIQFHHEGPACDEAILMVNLILGNWATMYESTACGNFVWVVTFYPTQKFIFKLLRRLEAVILDLGWKFWNYNLAYKINFDLLHTISSFQHMIKVNFLIGFQATAITIATEAQTLSF